MRRAPILACVVLLTTACASVPEGAYYPRPSAPATAVLARTLARAAEATGDDPARYSFALIPTPKVIAVGADDAVFYFSEGLAAQPPAHVEALVAQAVAHEVLGHATTRRGVRLGVSAGFLALGILVPGLGLADFVVNPIVVRAFTREQELAADQRAVTMLAVMGHPAPRRTLANALRAAAEINGPSLGGLFAKAPRLEDRLAALEPLEPASVAVSASRPVSR